MRTAQNNHSGDVLSLVLASSHQSLCLRRLLVELLQTKQPNLAVIGMQGMSENKTLSPVRGYPVVILRPRSALDLVHSLLFGVCRDNSGFELGFECENLCHLLDLSCLPLNRYSTLLKKDKSHPSQFIQHSYLRILDNYRIT